MRLLIIGFIIIFGIVATVKSCSKEEIRVRTGQLPVVMEKYYKDNNFNVYYIVEKINGTIDGRYNDLEELSRDYLHFCKKRINIEKCTMTKAWLLAYDDEDVRYMIGYVNSH